MPAPGSSPSPSPSPAQNRSVAFSPTTSDFANPERGFYGWGGDDFVTALDISAVKAGYASGRRLVFAKVQLDAFRTADFSDAWLNQLGASLAAVRAAGMKTTLLFSYDFTENGQDASSAQIKRHLEQLKPVLQANADVIPFMRAGFIGAWGEWHSSKAGNSCGYNAGTTPCTTADANRLIVRDALLANVPSSTQIGFRYPPDLQKWYPQATQQSRAGLHNDCFLAGPTDSGTFEDPASRDYAKALTTNTAYGGETCENAGTPIRNTCADILSEGAQYHLAWLNINYAPSVINAWKAGGCFDEVSRSMGYRLQLDQLSLPAAVARGSTATVSIDLSNIGWAKLFGERTLVVTLEHKTSKAQVLAKAGNLQALTPQATSSSRIDVNVALPANAEPGDYEVLLSVPDIHFATAGNPDFAVRFANADNATLGQLWDAAGAKLKTGASIKVE